jgi:hypothetical protein
MPLIEVEEEALKPLKGAKELLDALAGDPKTRHHLMALIKTKNPDLPLPEVDVPMAMGAVFDERTKKLEERLEEMQRKLAEKEVDQQVTSVITRERNRLREAGHSAETINEIEKLMQEEGIVSYAAAEALWEKRHPAPSPAIPDSGFSGTQWNFANPSEDADHELLLKNPKAFSQKAAAKVLSELRSGGRRA